MMTTKTDTDRAALFVFRGMDTSKAQALATQCAERDKAGDTGARTCMECGRLGRAGGERFRCGAWRELGTTRHAALLGVRFVVELHRCPSFTDGTARANTGGRE